jgi:hypothetical protein
MEKFHKMQNRNEKILYEISLILYGEKGGDTLVFKIDK